MVKKCKAVAAKRDTSYTTAFHYKTGNPQRENIYLHKCLQTALLACKLKNSIIFFHLFSILHI